MSVCAGFLSLLTLQDFLLVLLGGLLLPAFVWASRRLKQVFVWSDGLRALGTGAGVFLSGLGKHV